MVKIPRRRSVAVHRWRTTRQRKHTRKWLKALWLSWGI
nr:MAG TPA: hypothetical protein [Caudoviricetes sp.]